MTRFEYWTAPINYDGAILMNSEDISLRFESTQERRIQTGVFDNELLVMGSNSSKTNEIIQRKKYDWKKQIPKTW
jgi:hypothetical protein